MNRIKVGINCLLPEWEIILRQEGIPFEVVLLDKLIEVDKYSTLIITNKLSAEQEQFISDYQQNGGSVLWLAKNIKHTTMHKRVISVNDNSIFSDIGIFDVNGLIFIPEEGILFHKDLQIYSNKLGAGNSIILPFDIKELMLDFSKKRKKFYADRKELPSEIVAKASKNKIRSIARICIEYLHHQRNLPFIQKWYFPDREKNVFIFRIDTDFCSAMNAEKLLKVCRENNIRGSWFVDTDSEKKLAETYGKMDEQEIGLHCYRHLVFDDYQHNFDNTKNGISQLEKVGIKPIGYVAPFGDWNRNLGKALEKVEFKYSSEFTLDYDNLPFFPYFDRKFTKVLQIPIHPISMGRLNRSHFTEEEIVDYYKNVIFQKIQDHEPIILYHHPSQLRFELWDKIFAFIKEKKILNLTMSEFAEWWMKRESCELNCFYKSGVLSFTDVNSECYVRISTKAGFNVFPQKNITLSKVEWKNKSFNKNIDLSKMRKLHWREILYNYESMRARKHL